MCISLSIVLVTDNIFTKVPTTTIIIIIKIVVCREQKNIYKKIMLKFVFILIKKYIKKCVRQFVTESKVIYASSVLKNLEINENYL